jgi:hypothetical protein
VKKGDLIGVSAAAGNTHGCTDYAVLKANGDGTATVIEAESCTSCWQIGHDRDHTFATDGDVWEIGDGDVEEAGSDWPTNVKWQVSQ